LAGTEEGSPAALGMVKEGELVYGPNAARPIISDPVQECQAPKQVILHVGDVSGWWVDSVSWVDTIVPLQIFLVGNVALVGSSFEPTTMAGRRLRQRLLQTLAPAGVTDVVIAAIANSTTSI
jgi:neutral ceramidase